ncbi:energy transducer TonB [Pendulispora rubella]|uniref:Energy transducer TonB n=1 Tax=Pendulispora rubella TaxID=2741070 RepID=A0ABZ2KUP7_9BACT
MHVAVLGLAIYISVRAHQQIKKQATEVKFVAPPPPPPPPPVATAVPRTAERPKAKKEFVKKENTIVDSKEAPKEDTSAKSGSGESVEATCGVPGKPACCGGPGEPPCRHCGGAGEPACCGGPGEPACAPVKAAVCGDPGMPPCPPQTTVIPFGPGMAKPSLLAGTEQPTLPREALVAKVEGLILVKCTLTKEGTVEDCKFIKSLPYTEEAILANLKGRKYTPVMFQGQAQAVTYTFTFRIQAQ